MKLEINGTAAAEGIPSPFCRCRVCSEARLRGGKEIRGRAGALLDGVVQIDFGPDVFGHARQFGRDLSAATTLLFTHQHDDHLAPAELNYRSAPFLADTELPLMHVYGNRIVMDILRSQMGGEAGARKCSMRLEEPLRPHQPITTADDMTILPLPADHAAEALLLRIQRSGKALFYGHDSGLYPDETIEALTGAPLDLVLMDATNGIQDRNRGHMGLTGILESVEKMRKVGAITDSTQLVATHFSHNGRALHDELCARFEPEGIAVAYDGMVIDF